MIPLWCVIRIGSKGRKGFPLIIPLLLVYALLLVLMVPAFLLYPLFYMAGEKGERGKGVLLVLIESIGLIGASRGLTIDVADRDDKIRILIC